MNLINRILTLSLPAMVLMLSACQGDGDAAPVGSKVVIDPLKITLNVSRPADDPDTDANETDTDCGLSDYSYLDRTILVNVNDPSGAPLGKTDLLVTLGFTGQNSNGLDVIKLFDDVNNNGVIDSADINVTAAGMPAYTPNTDDAGVKRLLLRYQTNCYAYASYLTVYASGGNIAQTMEITVNRVIAGTGG